jgi:hypothetical protein
MSMFNATVNAIGIEVTKPEDDNSHLLVHIDLGMALPFSEDGTRPVIAPIGKITFPITKDAATQVGDKLSKLADQLTSSNIEIATDLAAAEKAAQALEGFKGNGQKS